MWEDVEGQEKFPVSAGFELTTHGLLVQEHNYSATTHSPTGIVMSSWGGGAPNSVSPEGLGKQLFFVTFFYATVRIVCSDFV